MSILAINQTSTVASERETVYLTEGASRLHLPVPSGEVARTYREGNDLVVVLASGREILVDDYFAKSEADGALGLLVDGEDGNVTVLRIGSEGEIIESDSVAALGRLQEMFDGSDGIQSTPAPGSESAAFFDPEELEWNNTTLLVTGGAVLGGYLLGNSGKEETTITREVQVPLRYNNNEYDDIDALVAAIQGAVEPNVDLNDDGTADIYFSGSTTDSNGDGIPDALQEVLTSEPELNFDLNDDGTFDIYYAGDTTDRDADGTPDDLEDLFRLLSDNSFDSDTAGDVNRLSDALRGEGVTGLNDETIQNLATVLELLGVSARMDFTAGDLRNLANLVQENVDRFSDGTAEVDIVGVSVSSLELDLDTTGNGTADKRVEVDTRSVSGTGNDFVAQSAEIDTDYDGTNFAPDIREEYSVGTDDARTDAEIDTDYDGTTFAADRREEYTVDEDGLRTEAEIDTSYDGTSFEANRFEFYRYENGQLVQSTANENEDSDGNGTPDIFRSDFNNDGTFETTAYDTDEDGTHDTIELRRDDGSLSEIQRDHNDDGTIDAYHRDINEDGTIDYIFADQNGNAIPDAFAFDMDYDGTFDRYEFDSYRLDLNLDGIFDLEDGTMDSVHWDLDDNGTVDFVRFTYPVVRVTVGVDGETRRSTDGSVWNVAARAQDSGGTDMDDVRGKAYQLNLGGTAGTNEIRPSETVYYDEHGRIVVTVLDDEMDGTANEVTSYVYQSRDVHGRTVVAVEDVAGTIQPQDPLQVFPLYFHGLAEPTVRSDHVRKIKTVDEAATFTPVESVEFDIGVGVEEDGPFHVRARTFAGLEYFLPTEVEIDLEGDGTSEAEGSVTALYLPASTGVEVTTQFHDSDGTTVLWTEIADHLVVPAQTAEVPFEVMVRTAETGGSVFDASRPAQLNAFYVWHSSEIGVHPGRIRYELRHDLSNGSTVDNEWLEIFHDTIATDSDGTKYLRTLERNVYDQEFGVFDADFEAEHTPDRTEHAFYGRDGLVEFAVIDDHGTDGTGLADGTFESWETYFHVASGFAEEYHATNTILAYKTVRELEGGFVFTDDEMPLIGVGTEPIGGTFLDEADSDPHPDAMHFTNGISYSFETDQHTIIPLVGISEVVLSGVNDNPSYMALLVDGSTTFTITDEALTVLADSNTDGTRNADDATWDSNGDGTADTYALTIDGGANDTVRLGAGISRITSGAGTTDDDGREGYQGTDGVIFVDAEVVVMELPAS